MEIAVIASFGIRIQISVLFDLVMSNYSFSDYKCIVYYDFMPNITIEVKVLAVHPL